MITLTMTVILKLAISPQVRELREEVHGEQNQGYEKRNTKTKVSCSINNLDKCNAFNLANTYGD